MIKYMEIDSSYRNRNLFPNPSQFDIMNTQNGNNFNLETSVDPISLSMPFVSYIPDDIQQLNAGGFQITFAVSLTSKVVTFSTAQNPSKIANYYSGLSMDVLTNLGNNAGPILIKEWLYINTVDNTDCFRITFTPALTHVSVGEDTAVVYFNVSTNFDMGHVFIPNGSLNFGEYVGYYIYNETQNEHSVIISYDGDFALASIEPKPDWVLTDTISVRKSLPFSFGNFQTGSTTTSVVLSATSNPNTGYYKGYFLRITQAGILYNFVCNIMQYTGSPNYIAYLNCVLPTAPISGYTYEILPYYRDNFIPLFYSGTQIQQEVCYEIQCIHLILPNVNVETGGIIQSYPYFLMEFQNFSTSNSGMIVSMYSNNPKTKRKLFKIPVTDSSPPYINSFVKLDKCYMSQTIKLNPSDNIKFGIYLPDGRPLVFSTKDTSSPVLPNPSLQVSALFSLKRISSL